MRGFIFQEGKGIKGAVVRKLKRFYVRVYNVILNCRIKKHV